jgi:tRNA(Ser,Leu) C12 N-acetylase TAN1
MLTSPLHCRADNLPRVFKDRAIEKIERHLEWLEPQDRLTRATNGYRGIITFLNQNDDTSLLAEFFKVTDDVDRVRDERFEDVFPEYQDLRSYVK